MALLVLSSNPSIARKGVDRDSGGVVVELALVAPVLLIMLFGMLAIGRAISQLAWMSQSAFQTYLIGAEFRPAERALPMTGRWLRVLDGNRNMVTGHRGPRAIDDPLMMEFPATEAEAFSVRVTGNLSNVMEPFNIIPLTVTITGPILAPDAAAAGDLNAPENPPVARMRNCMGSQGAASAASCFECPGSSLCHCVGNPSDTTWPCS